MAVFLKILGIISLVMIVCTVICGCWIRAHKVDDISFHFILSLSTVCVSFATILLYMIFK